MVMLVEDEATGQKSEECTFEPYEVYAVDVAFSTGEGAVHACLHCCRCMLVLEYIVLYCSVLCVYLTD